MKANMLGRHFKDLISIPCNAVFNLQSYMSHKNVSSCKFDVLLQKTSCFTMGRKRVLSLITKIKVANKPDPTTSEPLSHEPASAVTSKSGMKHCN